MHWFDAVAGLALLFGGIWSFFRGLTREVISLLGITAAFVLPMRGYTYIAQPLTPFIAQPVVRQAVGFAILFIAIVAVYILVARLLRRLIKAAGLSLPDRFLGGLFGLMKVTVIVSALVILVAQVSPPFATRLATESRLAPTFFRTASLLATLLPEHLYADFHRLYAQIRHRFLERLPARQPLAPSLAPRPTPPPAPRSAPAPTPPSHSDGISAGDAQALEKLIQERLKNP